MNNLNCSVVVGGAFESMERASSKLSQCSVGESCNVSVILNSREPPFKYLYRERLYLAERDSLYPCGVRGKIEARDAGE